MPTMGGIVQWCHALVTTAEQPAPFSAREGKLLRLVPPNRRMGQQQLAAQLQNALGKTPSLLAAIQEQVLLHQCKAQAAAVQVKPPLTYLRHVAALLRGWAYLTAGDAQQALFDARCALATAPRGASVQHPAASGITNNGALTEAAPPAAEGGISCSGTSGPGAADTAAVSAPGAVVVHGRSVLQGLHACSWAPAHELASAAYAAAEDWSNAALHAAIASELEPSEASYSQSLSELLHHLPDAQAAALEGGGAAGLVERLQQEAEERLPEFLRPRPKWYYYNRWMTQRISALHPGLPAPVTSKLLQQDAGELDFRVGHPEALNEQVQELLGVYASGGAAALESYTPAQLQWERVQQLVKPGAVGLPIGYQPDSARQQAVQGRDGAGQPGLIAGA